MTEYDGGEHDMSAVTDTVGTWEPIEPAPCPGSVTFPGLDTLRGLPVAQQPQWPYRAVLDDTVTQLRSMPPLVYAGECDELKTQLAAVARGKAFLLQGGDCAETL